MNNMTKELKEQKMYGSVHIKKKFKQIVRKIYR